MSKSLPYSMKDVHYDNAKFRQRSLTKVRTVSFRSNGLLFLCLFCYFFFNFLLFVRQDFDQLSLLFFFKILESKTVLDFYL